MKNRQAQSIRRFLHSGSLALALILLAMTGNPLTVSAACPAQDTSRGQVSISFNIPNTGTYRVWSRISAPDNNNNSYIMEIDGTTCGVVVGDSSIAANSWTWVSYKNGSTSTPIDVSLNAGSHNLVAIGRENSVSVDRVIFTTDTSCVPTGTGDNCVNTGTTPPPNGGGNTGGGSNSGGTSSSSTTLGSGTGSTVTIKASSNPVNVASGTDVVVAPATDASDIGNVTEVQYYIDGKLVDTETKAPFTYKVETGKLANGSHKLVSKVYFKDGTTKSTAQTLNVKNTAKKSSNPTAGIGISLLVVAAIIGGLILIQRSRGGFIWHGHTLIPADHAVGDDVAAVIRSSNAPPDSTPLSNATPAPGSVVEYKPDNGDPKPPQLS